MPDDTCVLIEKKVDGDRCLILENQNVRVAINADHGSHLYELVDRASGINLLHADALGSRHYRVGGWYELFPNAGSPCVLDGRELSQHGDIQHQSWAYRVTSRTAELIEIELTADSQEMPFRLTKTIRFSSAVPGVHVGETVTNLSDTALPYLWGHHITFGEPFMTAASRIDLPDVDVYAAGRLPAGAPYAPGARGPLTALPAPGGGTVDMTRFPDKPFTSMLFTDPMPQHWYNVWADDPNVGLAVAWDGSAFPVLWIWATRNGNPRDPSAIACALEPQSSETPGLADAVNAGQAPALGAAQSRSAWVRAVLHHNPERVTEVHADGTVQADRRRLTDR